MLQEILEDEYLKMFPKGSHIKIMGDYLKYKKNPVVLEFGVERGSSTKAFIWLTKKMNGKVYSIDINDCASVFTTSLYCSDILSASSLDTPASIMLVNILSATVFATAES